MALGESHINHKHLVEMSGCKAEMALERNQPQETLHEWPSKNSAESVDDGNLAVVCGARPEWWRAPMYCAHRSPIDSHEIRWVKSFCVSYMMMDPVGALVLVPPKKDWK
jgi:hypothetical protein